MFQSVRFQYSQVLVIILPPDKCLDTFVIW